MTSPLMPFCGDASRFSVSEPFVLDGFEWATDGRVLARREAIGIDDSPPRPEFGYPSVWSVWKVRCDYNAVAIPPLGTPILGPCSWCDGRGDKTLCDKCDGEGATADGLTCQSCVGSGLVPGTCQQCRGTGKDAIVRSVRLADDYYISEMYARLLVASGAREVHVPPHMGVACFWKSDAIGVEGFLMPILVQFVTDETVIDGRPHAIA